MVQITSNKPDAVITDLGGGRFRLTWTPPRAGVYQASLVATDALGASTLRAFTITANTPTPTPRPPTVGPVAPVRATVDRVVQVRVPVSDPDGDVVSVTATGSTPPPVVIGPPSDGRWLVEFIPETVGPMTITVKATDSTGVSGSASFVVNVEPDYNPPTISPIADLESVVGNEVSVSFTVTGAATDSFTVATSGITPPATVTAGTGGSYVMKYTPTAVGTDTITVKATGSTGLMSERTFKVVVSPAPVNNPPTITGLADKTAVTGTELVVQFMVADPEGGTVAVSSAGLTGATVAPTTGGQYELRWTPTVAGTTVGEIRADDGVNPATVGTFTVVVSAADGPTAGTPTVSPASVTVGSPVTFDASAVTDPDGALTYVWRFGDGVGSGGVTVTHPYTATGTYTWTLRAIDPFGREKSYEGTVTVTAVQPLTVTKHPDATTTWNAAAPVTGNLVAVTDGTAPYTYQASGLPAGLSVDAATGVLSGTATAISDGTVTVTVTDSGTPQRTGSVNFTWSVPDREATMVATLSTNTVVVGEELGVFVGQVADPDGLPLSFEWDFGDGTPPETADSPTHVYDTAGVYTVTVTTTDTAGGTTDWAVGSVTVTDV